MSSDRSLQSGLVVVGLIPLLSGCGLFDELRSEIDGITNAFVVESIYLGVVEPDARHAAVAVAVCRAMRSEHDEYVAF